MLETMQSLQTLTYNALLYIKILSIVFLLFEWHRLLFVQYDSSLNIACSGFFVKAGVILSATASVMVTAVPNITSHTIC